MSFSVENFQVCMNAVLPIFFLMAAGYIARAAGLLDERDVSRMNRIAFMTFMPALLFHNIYNSDLSSSVDLRLIAFALGGVLCAYAVSILASRGIDRKPARRGVIIQGLFRSNFVIIGLPIAESLMGGGDLGQVAILIAVIVPTFNILSVITLELFCSQKTRPGRVVLDIAKNPLVIASAVGVLFLLTGLKLPSALESAVSQMAGVASPLMLFLLGAFFQFRGIGEYKKQLFWTVLGRLILIPGLAFSAAALLGIRDMAFVSLIGIFGSATAVASFTMAQQMGGDSRLAGNIVVLTSAFCPFTLFLWCFLFKSLGIF